MIPVALNISKELYKQGLKTILHSIQWVSLFQLSDLPAHGILITDQPAPSSQYKTFFVAECSKGISLCDRSVMGIACMGEISSPLIQEALLRIGRNLNYYSPKVQQVEMTRRFKQSIGQDFQIIELIIAQPSATYEVLADQMKVSRSTFMKRLQDIHCLFESASKAELIVKVYESGLAPV